MCSSVGTANNCKFWIFVFISPFKYFYLCLTVLTSSKCPHPAYHPRYVIARLKDWWNHGVEPGAVPCHSLVFPVWYDISSNDCQHLWCNEITVWVPPCAVLLLELRYWMEQGDCWFNNMDSVSSMHPAVAQRRRWIISATAISRAKTKKIYIGLYYFRTINDVGCPKCCYFIIQPVNCDCHLRNSELLTKKPM